jgi:hypothetical protein
VLGHVGSLVKADIRTIARRSDVQHLNPFFTSVPPNSPTSLLVKVMNGSPAEPSDQDHVTGVGGQLAVGGEQLQPLNSGLGQEHPVEWVAMKWREGGYGESMLTPDRQFTITIK